jgi:hypothetical protein
MATMAIASAVTFLVGCACIHETSYERMDINLPATEYPPKRTWTQNFSFTSGYDPNASFFGWLGNTLVILAYPPVVMVGLITGVFVGWQDLPISRFLFHNN